MGNLPNIMAVWRIRESTRSAARSSCSAIQSRIATRSSRACGVKLTFKAEFAPHLLRRDHRIAIGRLREATLDFRALPFRIALLFRSIVIGYLVIGSALAGFHTDNLCLFGPPNNHHHRISTSSSAIDGCSATVSSNCALVSFAFTAIAAACRISGASGLIMWIPSTTSLSEWTTSL